MNLNIDNLRKAKYIESSLQSIAQEIYISCSRFGIDPDEVDVANPSSNVDLLALNSDPATQAAYSTITTLCSSYVKLTEKLQSL